MRFRPEQHLRRQQDFRAVRSEGRKLDCGVFTVWMRKRPEAGIRAGFVASTASVGGAILRNRAKRRLREVFRRHQQLVPGGSDVLLVARRPVTSLPFAELESRFAQACRKLGS